MAKLTINQVLEQAIDAHKAGKSQEAHRLYAAILKVQPKHPDANHNTGLLTVGFGKIKLAIPFFKTALEANPSNAQFWYSHIIALIKLERLIDAKVLLDQAKSKGIKGADFDQLEQRLNDANKALGPKPDYVRVYYNMGIAFKKQNKLEEAIEAYNKALAIKPDYANAYYKIGIILHEQNKLEEAIEAYNKALAVKPDYADAYYNMGTILQQQNKLEEAIEAYNKAIAIKPDDAGAYNNMGIALDDQGKLEEAIEAYNKALAIKPDDAGAYNNMGIVLKKQNKLEEAIEAYDKALAIKPDDADAYYNMGIALADQGKLEEAIEAYKKALAFKPDHAEAHHNMSFALLATKNFYQGFKQSEWRWKTKNWINSFLKSTKPMWNGEKKQRVLVWGEQGIGDEIMFSSIIPDLYAASSRVLVQCDKRLIPLFKRSFPTDVIYYPKEAHVSEGAYDLHIPMGSLPLNFRKSLDSFKKSASGFLKCNTDAAKSIKGPFIHKQSKKLVGISWKTKSALKNSYTRNINLADLARALDNSNIQLVNLQYGDVSDEIEAVERDFGIDVIQFGSVDNKNDIDDLASLIGACDMVFTIDNATAHLSGALGVPTKLMLPYIANWRWGVSEDSSYWYNALQLHRQSKTKDWRSVLAQL